MLIIAIFVVVLAAYAAGFWNHANKNATAANMGRSVGIVFVGNQPYNVLIARNLSEQEQGLMNYTNLSAGGIAGELFINLPGRSCFWMKNTPEPLTQSWINYGKVVYVYNATPSDLNTVCADGTSVLELMKGINIHTNQTVREVI